VFVDRALAVMKSSGPLVFGLDPSGDVLESWGLGDTPDGLDRFVDIGLEASVGTVGAVKPQAAFYERHGWRGMRSLTRLVESCRSAGLLVILDAKRGDVGSTMAAYADAYLGDAAAIPVDAITVTPFLGFGSLSPFVDRSMNADAGILVVTRSSNPEGRSIQQAVNERGTPVEATLMADIAAANARLSPGGLGPIGAVFGPTHGPPRFDIRSMNGLFLAPGVGAQGATACDVAACFATCADRVLPSSSRALLRNGPDVGRLKKGAEVLALELEEAGVGP
jgi:orotidine-5'-phosphate decarboxylase